MLILPSAYLPPIGYFAELVTSSTPAVVDTGEHYVKRSIRNRTEILTAQGVIALTIPVKRANTPRSKMSGMEIDNSKRWQHQHWITILSAYGSSPYFEHYAPYFEPLYRAEWRYLTEFNSALTSVVLKLLRVKKELYPTTSAEYVAIDNTSSETTGDTRDLRPKIAQQSMPVVDEYIQVFSDRQRFVAGLSILDLLFCEGTNALSLLEASHRQTQRCQ